MDTTSKNPAAELSKPNDTPAAPDATIAEGFGAIGLVTQLSSVRNVQLAWGASVVSESMALVALLVLAYDVGGASLVGVFAAARLLPALVIGPLVTGFADRVRRNRLLVTVLTVRALLMVTALGLLLAGKEMAALVAGGMCAVLFVTHRPLNASLLPCLVPAPGQLTAANVASAAVESTGFLVGPVVAAILMARFGPTVVLGVAAWGLGVAVVASARIDTVTGGRPPARRMSPISWLTGYTQDLRVGMSGLAEQPMVMTVGFVQTACRGAVTVLTVVLALEVLRIGDSGVGWLAAAFGAGGVAGAAVAARIITPTRLHRGFLAGVALWGLPLLALAVWPVLPVAVVAIAVVGVGNAIEDVSLFTLLPCRANPSELGRVLGAFEITVILGLTLGSFAAPLLVQAFGVQVTFLVVGVLVAAVAISWLRYARRSDAAHHVNTRRRRRSATSLSPPEKQPTDSELPERDVPMQLTQGIDQHTQYEGGIRWLCPTSHEPL